jgi:hypothetical protein
LFRGWPLQACLQLKVSRTHPRSPAFQSLRRTDQPGRERTHKRRKRPSFRRTVQYCTLRQSCPRSRIPFDSNTRYQTAHIEKLTARLRKAASSKARTGLTQCAIHGQPTEHCANSVDDGSQAKGQQVDMHNERHKEVAQTAESLESCMSLLILHLKVLPDLITVWPSFKIRFKSRDTGELWCQGSVIRLGPNDMFLTSST